MRLSFCLPYIEYPRMQPVFDDEIIKSLNVKVVENKPEAPWIKWKPEGVVFTGNMLIDEERSIENINDLLNQSHL